jgi:DNA modification methylase
MNKIEFGDNRTTMKRWIAEGVKVQTCVTSPPYYGLRDYGTGNWVGGDINCSHKRDSKYSENTITGHANKELTVGDAIYKSVCPKCGAIREDLQLGLEETPEEYVSAMVDVFRHVRDLLEDDGTLWLNIGDSYASQGGRQVEQTVRKTDDYVNSGQLGSNGSGTSRRPPDGIKAKDLIGIPWMLAFALRADGWYLRQDIIWHKPNPMPESVQDRCTKSHEYIFLLSKSSKYYYDHEAIKEPIKGEPEIRNKNAEGYQADYAHGDRFSKGERVFGADGMANKRSVWSVPVKPYSGAHFAVFPSDLIEPCILAGAPVGGIVLDPFMGSGTTAQVAQDLGRQYLGCELNPKYKSLQDKRIAQMSLQLV